MKLSVTVALLGLAAAEEDYVRAAQGGDCHTTVASSGCAEGLRCSYAGEFLGAAAGAEAKAERERIASGLRAEGAQRDAEIRANVDRKVTVLIETAEGTSARLRGEAESEAIAVLAESLNKDPELYAFKRYLETYAKSLNEGDTVVLSSDSPLFKYLKDQSFIEIQE